MSSLRDPGFMAAIEAAGSANKLAEGLGITPQALSQWKRVPPLRVLAVSQLTGLAPHILRPDVYPVPASEAA